MTDKQQLETRLKYLNLNRSTTANSRFAKAGVSCFYDSEVLNSSFVHPMKFSAKNPPLPRESLRVVLQFKILKNTNIV